MEVCQMQVSKREKGISFSEDTPEVQMEVVFTL